MNDKKPALEMREYRVSIAVVPTIIEVELFGAKIEYKTVVIKGYTKKDAMRRAGIS